MLFFSFLQAACLLLLSSQSVESFRASNRNFLPRKYHGIAASSSCSKYINGYGSKIKRQSTDFSLKMSSKDDNPFYQGLDAYQILEIPRSSDKKTIKKAFRKLVSQWHPDKFPGDEEKKKEGTLRMEKINRAYYCLEDDDRRQRYDRFGEQGVGSSAASEEQMKNAGGPGMGGFGGGATVDVGDISDIFDAFFGGAGGGGGGGGFGGRRTRTSTRDARAAGEDIQVDAQIPFMTAIFGGNEKIRIRRLEECKTCTGTGVKPGAKVSTCSVCNGQGAVNNLQRTPFGTFQNLQTCPNCRGSGQEVSEYCPTCIGKGTTSETKEMVINIPQGVDSGATMRVREGGNAGRKGGPRGDLFVRLNVKDDSKFRRQGTDIYTEEEIYYTDAILGAKISADTVDGKAEVRIPAGTQPGQKLRLKSRGVPKMGAADGARGDAFITVKVKIPTNVSGKEKELVEEIAEKDKKAGGGGGGFFGFGGKAEE